jgi:hypothetical protein
MRFMTIYKPADTKALESGTPPKANEIARMGEFIGEMVKAGVAGRRRAIAELHRGARAAR